MKVWRIASGQAGQESDTASIRSNHCRHLLNTYDASQEQMDRQIKMDEKFVKLDLSPLTGNINSLQHSRKLIWMWCPYTRLFL